MSNTFDIAATIILAASCALLTGWLTHELCADKWQKEAVQAGHAEYFLDNEYQRQWRWKTNTAIKGGGE